MRLACPTTSRSDKRSARTSSSAPRVAQQSSRAETDADLHSIREVPHWQ